MIRTRQLLKDFVSYNKLNAIIAICYPILTFTVSVKNLQPTPRQAVRRRRTTLDSLGGPAEKKQICLVLDKHV